MSFGILSAGVQVVRSVQEAADSLNADSLVAELTSDSAAVEPFFQLPTGPALFVLIAGGALSLLLGLWIGRPTPGELRENAEEIMSSGYGRRRKVARAFTPIAWLQRNISARRDRSGISIKRPGED